MTDTDQKCSIFVWPFDDAPEFYRSLSPHGGDEDWLAMVPAHYAETWLPWLESGTGFGRCKTSEHVLGDGSKVYIGAHA